MGVKEGGGGGGGRRRRRRNKAEEVVQGNCITGMILQKATRGTPAYGFRNNLHKSSKPFHSEPNLSLKQFSRPVPAAIRYLRAIF